MQVVVQEGQAVVSLTQSIQAHDEALRATTITELTDDVKVFYRDHEVVRVEARDGKMELLAPAVASLLWLEKGRRYQLKAAD
jgi:hypothetical protein